MNINAFVDVHDINLYNIVLNKRYKYTQMCATIDLINVLL